MRVKFSWEVLCPSTKFVLYAIKCILVSSTFNELFESWTRWLVKYGKQNLIIGWKQVPWRSTATVSQLSDQMRYSTISTRKEWPVPHELPKYTFQVSTHRFLQNPWLVHCFCYWWNYDFPFNKLIFPPVSFLRNIDDGQENHTIYSLWITRNCTRTYDWVAS